MKRCLLTMVMIVTYQVNMTINTLPTWSYHLYWCMNVLVTLPVWHYSWTKQRQTFLLCSFNTNFGAFSVYYLSWCLNWSFLIAIEILPRDNGPLFHMSWKHRREMLNYHYIRPIMVARDTEAIILNESSKSISQSCAQFIGGLPIRILRRNISGLSCGMQLFWHRFYPFITQIN